MPPPPRAIDFVKMHGCGNDYVYAQAFWQILPADLPELARRVADRHRGVGGDGLIVLLKPDTPDAHVRMRMFNADGSEGEMCGNGVRCVAKLAWDDGLARHNPVRVQTGRGVLPIDLTLDDAGRVAAATVDMGTPILDPADVPVDTARLRKLDDHTWELADGDTRFAATFVSMGNPHAVIYVDDLAAIDLPRVGPRLENHPAFPRRMNVHFVRVGSADAVDVLHWERGSGATLACGTGACAVCVAGVLTGRTARRLRANLPGGTLTLAWPADDAGVSMHGEAVEVFRGRWAVG